MSKCRYCCDYQTSKDIIYKQMPIFLGQKMNITLDLMRNQLGLYIISSFNGMETSDGISLRTKVNYCPMCGRKLESEG